MNNAQQSRNRWLGAVLAAGLGIGALSASTAALAHVDVGVNIGVPGIAYAPEPVYAPPPPPVYAPPPPPVYAPPPPPGPVVVVSPGWYGERYYDGHRYWERREWEERHHDHGWHGRHEGWHGHDDGCAPDARLNSSARFGGRHSTSQQER